jgi:hypothetical protein
MGDYRETGSKDVNWSGQSGEDASNPHKVVAAVLAKTKKDAGDLRLGLQF